MGWTVSLFVLAVFGSAVVAIAVGVGSLRHRPDPMAWPLAVLMFAVAAWSIPHAISLGYTGIEQVSVWHRLRYPGVAVAPVAYLVVALRYAGHERWLSWRTYALLAVIPVASTVIVWTTPVHGLYWQSLSVTRLDGASVIVETFGPWRPVNLGYLYLVTAISLMTLGAVVVRSGPIYRKQALAMFVGGLVPLATNVADTVGLIPGPGIDFTAMALAVTGLTFALALFHLDLLEIRPIARERLIDELDDGVVVIGPDERIRDFNPTAVEVLENISIGQSAEEILPSDVAHDGGNLVVETDGRERQFRTRTTTLTDNRGRDIGRIVYLNDITDLIEREQRISVLNRILRHNIRNELNIATGHLEILEDQGREKNREHIETAKETVHRVIEFAEKARHVERTLQRSETTMVVSSTTVVERTVRKMRERYPDVAIEYEFPKDPENRTAVRVVDEDLFEMAIAELVENAVVHTDRESPEVIVGVEPGSDRVRVSVTDNGPGIPAQERAILTSRRESALEHSSGLGLWLVKWTVSLSDGDLSFEERQPRGTTVILSLPSAE